jgi:N6-L-threonylcarbamoyladenine synthase
VLATKTARAAATYGAKGVLLAGGVAANAHLRHLLAAKIDEQPWTQGKPDVRWPEFSLCTDNAAMIAGLGYRRFQGGMRSGLDADAFPRWPIGSRA